MVVLTTIITTLMSYRSGKAGTRRTITSDLTMTVRPAVRRARMCRNILPTTSNPNVHCILALGALTGTASAACALSIACLSTRNGNGSGAFASGKGPMGIRGAIGSGGGATVGLGPDSKDRPICFMVTGSAALALTSSDLRMSRDSLGCGVVHMGWHQVDLGLRGRGPHYAC